MKRSGFTLIEIIMAMAILAIGIMGVVRLMPVGLKASKSSETISKATFLAQQKMEELKLAGFSALTAEEPQVPLSGEEGDYTWSAEVAEVSAPDVSGYANMRQLNLTVEWQERGRPRAEMFVTYIGE